MRGAGTRKPAYSGSKSCSCGKCIAVRRLTHECEQARAALQSAMTAFVAAEDELRDRAEQLADFRADSRFCRLRQAVSALVSSLSDEDSEIVAYHMWMACNVALGSLATACGLHMDDLDTGILLKFIQSLGINELGNIVQLRGCLLMVLLRFSASNLEDACRNEGITDICTDRRGNVILFEPKTRPQWCPCQAKPSVQILQTQRLPS